MSRAIRTIEWDDLPPRAKEIPANIDILDKGLLMKHQRDWCKLVNKEDLCICVKGRRTGITYATALNFTPFAAASRENNGDNVFYIGDTKEKGLEFIGYCAHMARVMAARPAGSSTNIEEFQYEDRIGDDKINYITAYRIRFPKPGHQIVALSSRPASIRGLQGIVIIDEAAYHQNVQAVIDACLALIIWGGKILLISTHNGIKNPFNQLVRDTRAGMYAFKIFECYFDDAVKNGLYERVCLIKGWTPTEEGKKQWYLKVRGAYGANKAAMLEELDGIPREGSGVAIPGILIEECMKEVRPIARLALETEFALKPLEYRDSWIAQWIKEKIDPLIELLDKDKQHHFGFDYSRYCDFAVFGPMTIEQFLTRKVPWLVEFHNVPTRHQQQILFYIIDRLPKFRSGAMDATGNGQTIAEYAADKYDTARTGRIHEVTLNDAWYRDNMGRFVEAFENQTIDIGKDADVLNDLRALERIDGIVKLPKIKTPDTKNSDFMRHGDAAICLVLGYFATLSNVVAASGGADPKPRQTLAGAGRFREKNKGGFFGRFKSGLGIKN